jgi:hypothetical protein
MKRDHRPPFRIILVAEEMVASLDAIDHKAAALQSGQ